MTSIARPARTLTTPRWTTGPVLGFDTETTGVDPQTDRIVSAALVHRTPRVATTVRTWLIDPGVEIPAGASAVHGISTAQAREHGADPRDALEEIATSLAEALAEGVPVVAFNAGFDLGLLDAELSRHALATLPRRIGRPVTAVVDPLVLDRALERYRRGKRTLGALSVAYGVLDPDGPGTAALHAADADVVATLDLLEAMVAAFPELDTMTLDELYAFQVAKHREWAEDFNDWRRRQGLPGPGASTVWPF
jgi:DNA polymerase-3 subunit epsilon